jgi:pyruvate kinase
MEAMKQMQGKDNFVMPTRHCKIIGTIGPASSSEEVLRELILAGMDIARLNFSHGEHEVHAASVEKIRRISKELGRNVAILQDLQGPKIRCGRLLGGKIDIVSGEEYTLVFGIEQTDPRIIPIDYRELAQDVAVGQTVMMDDGLLIFKITSIMDGQVVVQATEGGTLKSRKGVNFPDAVLSLPAMTEKDSKDLLFGISQGVDWVALSFVQTPKDVMQVKNIIKAMGTDIPVIAKIEKLSAVRDIDEIAAVSDGIMVARGDLGVEGRVERVPMFQRRIVAAARKHARPVIVATQMLESMVVSPRATLAEIADVANGVLDDADCLMLSAEVASGKNPVACVEQMAAIIDQVEAWRFKRSSEPEEDVTKSEVIWPVHEAIGRAAGEAADALGAKLIVCLTLTGSIARSIARWRPKTPILAISPRAEVIRRLGLVWGVGGIQNQLFYDTDILLHELPQVLKNMNLVSAGETVVITAGIPINQVSATNMIKINRIA